MRVPGVHQSRTRNDKGEAVTDHLDDDIHPAARAVIDPHLYRTDPEYHAAADQLSPILRVIEAELGKGTYLGPDEFLARVAYRLLPTEAEAVQRQREHRELVRLAGEQIRAAFGLPPEIVADWEQPEPQGGR